MQQAKARSVCLTANVPNLRSLLKTKFPQNTIRLQGELVTTFLWSAIQKQSNAEHSHLF